MRAPNLQQEVEHELTWDPSLTSDQIGITANDGVVTLTGYVSSFSERVAAERAALRVKGVQSVANDIRVRLLHERTDSDIAAAAASTLASQINVPDTVKAAVRNGLVVLEGTVQWRYQKHAAEEAVRHLTGIIGVSNELKITPRILPLLVKSEIEEALRRSAETDAQGIHVSVTDRSVTLTGRVRSYAEKLDAERAAWAARGVTTVQNDLRIQF